MLKLKHILKGTAVGTVVVSALASAPAMAAGTQAGTVITNTVTVNYQVNSIAQTEETSSDEITVDRKVDLVVARTDNTATSVTPGAVDQAVSFQVTNLSNDTLDFELSALRVDTGNAAGISGTTSFEVEDTLTYYDDSGSVAGVWDSGDAEITHLDALAPDTPVVVHVVTSAVPGSLTTGDIASIVLTATARANDNGTGLGSVLTQDTSNTAGVDTIFADEAGATDSDRDAAHSAIDDYIVFAAALTATKTSTIIAGSGIFEAGAAIPGATVEYCITVTNASGGAAADNVVISDTLPAEVTYDDVYGVHVGGANCATPGSDDGEENSGTVSGTIASLPAGDSQTLIFRATIN